MITTQNITLDLHTQSYFSCMVYAKQGDDATRQIRVTLTESGQPYTIPDGVSASFRCLKPDGTCCESPALIDEEKAITVVLTEQILAVPGAISADICLEDGEGDTLSTASFVIRVEPVPFGIEVESINEFLELRAIVVKNKELTGEYETALAQLLAIQSASETAADLAQAAAQNASASESSASQAAQAAAVSEQNAANAAQQAQVNADANAPSAFNGNNAMELLDVKSVGNAYNAWGGCISLTALILRHPTAVCAMPAWPSTCPLALGEGVVYVPGTMVDSYKASSTWSTYTGEIKAIEDYPDICGEVQTI